MLEIIYIIAFVEALFIYAAWNGNHIPCYLKSSFRRNAAAVYWVIFFIPGLNVLVFTTDLFGIYAPIPSANFIASVLNFCPVWVRRKVLNFYSKAYQ